MKSPANAATVNALLQRQQHAWETGDADAVAADFAEDAVFAAPHETYRGRVAIREAAAGFFAYAQRVEIDVSHVWTDGRTGVVEWAWLEVVRKGGTQRRANDAIVFEIANGNFIHWREYINWLD